MSRLVRVRLLDAIEVSLVHIAVVHAQGRVDDVVRVIEAVHERHGTLAQLKAQIGDLEAA